MQSQQKASTEKCVSSYFIRTLTTLCGWRFLLTPPKYLNLREREGTWETGGGGGGEDMVKLQTVRKKGVRRERLPC